MTRREQETAEILRKRLAERVPKPTEEFRYTAWRAFQAAIDRSLLARKTRR